MSARQRVSRKAIWLRLAKTMAFEVEEREALSLLQGIENGTLQGNSASYRVSEADPALIYLIFTWLRSRYGADHPAAEGVIGRLVELSANHSIKAQLKEGKEDAIACWFESEHSYKEFDATRFISLIVEKLEG